jgi:sodium/hydrogen antiporter
MSAGALVALAAVVLAWSVVSDRLAKWNVGGPLVFLVAGLLLANPDWGVVEVDIESDVVHTMAELTLALLLFADASSVRLAAARRDAAITVRLLAIGLPLTIAGGIAFGALLFTALPIALVALVASALAPTDAALSASVIGDERLPGGLRRVLNVESGLNDGIATPVVTFCLASAAGVLGITGHAEEAGWSALGQLAVGAGVGIAIGFGGGVLLVIADRHGWMEHGSRRTATLALALLAFLAAEEVGGNPFVSAFVGGLAFGASAGRLTAPSVELTELAGGLLSLAVWFVFGAGFVLGAFEELDGRVVVYAILSLTVVRMVPVAIALLGSGQPWATTAFIGWFGPRGLASVVFALLAVEKLGESDPRVGAALHAIVVTVVLSVVAHGVSARPLTTRYVAALSASPRPAPPHGRVRGR